MEEANISLPDAIRLGAKLYPQCRGAFFEYDNNWREVVATCALGAAFEFTTGRQEISMEALYQLFPDWQLSISAVSLWNDMGATREQIADWLDELDAEIKAAVGTPRNVLFMFMKVKCEELKNNERSQNAKEVEVLG